jgi:hypothetical protein
MEVAVPNSAPYEGIHPIYPDSPHILECRGTEMCIYSKTGTGLYWDEQYAYSLFEYLRGGIRGHVH